MRIIRPFLLLPRGGQPTVGGDPDTPEVVKDFRPANVLIQPVPEAPKEEVPKALTTQDSSATGSASDSPDDSNGSKTPDTSKAQSSSSPSASSESPADAEKAKLLHPSALTTAGSSKPPVGA